MRRDLAHQYFAFRGHRLHEEHELGRATLLHCPTKDMLADALTKLSTASVLGVLQEAMQGRQPPFDISTTPTKAVSACSIGDGPSVALAIDVRDNRPVSSEISDVSDDFNINVYNLNVGKRPRRS